MQFTHYLDAVKWCRAHNIDVLAIKRVSFYKWHAPKRK